MHRQCEPIMRSLFHRTFFLRAFSCRNAISANPNFDPNSGPNIGSLLRGELLSRGKSGRVISLLAGAALLLAAATAHAQFGSQPVGAATGNQSVTVTASVAGTVSNVEILSLGSPTGDFAAGTGTSNCASATLALAATCTESITFTPAKPG